MTDVFTKAKRSAVMALIRGTGNRDTELRLIVLMRAAGIAGWRRGVSLRFISRDFAPRNAGEAHCGPVGPQWGWKRGAKVRLKVERGKLKAGLSQRPFRLRALREKSSVVKVRPDFVFPKQHLAVFVDGCYWHGCPKHATWPKNNAAFWRAKILGNMARDRKQTRLLRKNEWRVIRIWEHALTAKNALRTIDHLKRRVDVSR